MPVSVPALIGTTYALNPHSGKAPPGMKEISMGGTNTKALAVPGTKAPAKPRRSNPAGGWMETLVTYIVPTLTGGLLGALNGMNPDWWRDLALHWKGVIMTVISGGARWWESESKRSALCRNSSVQPSAPPM